MAKKANRRGGRKPGAWIQVKPEQILAYRKEHKLSRLTMAKSLGVSATTIQNWETGRGVATKKAQVLLLDRLASPPLFTIPSRGRQPDAAAVSNGSTQAIEATGQIMAAYFKGARIEIEQVGGLVRQIRAALS